MMVLVALVLVLVANVRVESATCEGKCNIVLCGQSKGGPRLDSMEFGAYLMAEAIKNECYWWPSNTCGETCNVGSVFYRDVPVTDDAVCAMVTDPLATELEKSKCMADARASQGVNEVTDNKLELCFERLNTDPGMMATTNTNCKYTVVVVASDQLTNSDVANLKTQAAQLKNKGATIHCYLVGTSAAIDVNYKAICDKKTRVETYRLFNPIIEKFFGKLKCCPGQQ